MISERVEGETNFKFFPTKVFGRIPDTIKCERDCAIYNTLHYGLT